MVVFDVDVIFQGNRFKMMLARDSGGGVGGMLSVVENSTTSVINEESTAGKTLFFTTKRSVEPARICRQVVIGGDTIAGIEVTTLQDTFVG